MKLLTKEIKEQLKKYPLYSQENKGKGAVVVCKFFLCQGAWTWYVLEADENCETMFGVVINGYGEGEYGYFSMSELQSVRGMFGLGVERDTSFTPTKLCEVKDSYLKKFLA